MKTVLIFAVAALFLVSVNAKTTPLPKFDSSFLTQGSCSEFPLYCQHNKGFVGSSNFTIHAVSSEDLSITLPPVSGPSGWVEGTLNIHYSAVAAYNDATGSVKTVPLTGVATVNVHGRAWSKTVSISTLVRDNEISVSNEQLGFVKNVALILYQLAYSTELNTFINNHLPAVQKKVEVDDAEFLMTV